MNLENEVKNCVDVLTNGGVILYPTDTIWGLGCDATNEKAVAKIFEIKKRVTSKSLIVIVEHAAMLKEYTSSNTAAALSYLDRVSQPVTIIYPHAKNLAPNVLAADGSVGIRIVKDDFCEQLLRQFGKPIVSTSANISNEEHAAIFSEVNPAILEAVDYIVQHRQNDTEKRVPSQLVLLSNDDTIQILRK